MGRPQVLLAPAMHSWALCAAIRSCQGRAGQLHQLCVFHVTCYRRVPKGYCACAGRAGAAAPAPVQRMPPACERRHCMMSSFMMRRVPAVAPQCKQETDPDCRAVNSTAASHSGCTPHRAVQQPTTAKTLQSNQNLNTCWPLFPFWFGALNLGLDNRSAAQSSIVLSNGTEPQHLQKAQSALWHHSTLATVGVLFGSHQPAVLAGAKAYTGSLQTRSLLRGLVIQNSWNKSNRQVIRYDRS